MGASAGAIARSGQLSVVNLLPLLMSCEPREGLAFRIVVKCLWLIFVGASAGKIARPVWMRSPLTVVKTVSYPSIRGS